MREGMLTPEQAEAERDLLGAIQAYAATFDDVEDGFIGDWLVVVECPGIAPEVDGTPYRLLMAGGFLPPHRATGLLTIAQELAATHWTEE